MGSENPFHRLTDDQLAEWDQLHRRVNSLGIEVEDFKRAWQAATDQLDGARASIAQEKELHRRTEENLSAALMVARADERRARAQLGVIGRAVDALLKLLKVDTTKQTITVDASAFARALAELEEVMILVRRLAD